MSETNTAMKFFFCYANVSSIRRIRECKMKVCLVYACTTIPEGGESFLLAIFFTLYDEESFCACNEAKEELIV